MVKTEKAHFVFRISLIFLFSFPVCVTHNISACVIAYLLEVIIRKTSRHIVKITFLGL